MKWLAYSLATLALWGAWGVLLKFASEASRSWKEVYVTTNLAIIAVVALILLLEGPQALLKGRAGLVALAAGFAGTLGFIFMVAALEAGGQASVVIPITSAYPVVTVVLSRMVLGEHLDAWKIIGVVMVTAGVMVLSMKG